VTEYHLVRTERPVPTSPVLDADQRQVIDHAGGPLLVLAGPGTGKTTTLVETVVARVEAGVPVEQILMLTFSRKAASDLRDRVTARLGRTIREPIARTIHSYAFGVLRMAALRDAEPGTPRLLGGAEQDVVVRQLLAGGDATLWPEALRPALATDGFAGELRDLIMRAIERGYDGEKLEREGRRRGRPDWIAAGQFLAEYENVNALDPSKGFDQAALIRAAINALEGDADLLADERGRRRRIYVDEYQDTDPAQAALLQLLAAGSDELILVGDPDQSIYAFRGADQSVIADVDDRFGAGSAVPVVALRTCRRFGPTLLEATRRIAFRLPGRADQRHLIAADGVADGVTDVAVFRSASDEAAHIANELRRTGLGTSHGVATPWAQMAVLVRSTSAIGTLRRALVAAGVPIALRREELPLAEQPIVSTLLDILGYAAGAPMTDALAEALLLGPIGRGDSLRLRKLRRALRQIDADMCLADVVSDPSDAQVLPDYEGRQVRRVADTLAAAKDAYAAGGNAEDVLWAAWSATRLSAIWEQSALRADAAGAAANRDLDAVVQLFVEAADFVDRLPGVKPEGFAEHLRAQQIPGDAFTRSGASSGGVSILTAHASKGLEWDVVCVAGVQEGTWPDLRRRGTLLGVEHLAESVELDEGAVLDQSDSARQLAEERRLFYVAVTRARQRLLVTAVSGEEDQPSRFLDELAPPPVEGRPVTKLTRGMHLAGLVAELRSVVCDPSAAQGLRAEAADRLAELAMAGIPGADPDEWWGLSAISSDAPVKAQDEKVYIGPSRIESFVKCELRGLMDMLGVRGEESAAASLGTLIHKLAAEEADRPLDELHALLDERIAALEFEAPWLAANERERARGMLVILVEWLANSRREYTHIGNELEFSAEVGGAVISGRVDRLEQDADGRLVVVDFKTGKHKVPGADMPQHPQLGAYQVAVEHGAFAEHGESSGGAMLLQLSQSTVKSAVQEQQPLAESTDPDWALKQVQQVVRVVQGTSFRAMANSRCNICDVRTSCPLQPEGRQVTS
jgi:superfamily I DNA/RNA helicase/RecB family exonuclease